MIYSKQMMDNVSYISFVNVGLVVFFWGITLNLCRGIPVYTRFDDP